LPLAVPTPADVRIVITTALDDAAITALIGDAALIAEACPMVAGYDALRQIAIIKWLTAHLIAQQSGQAGALTQKTLGDASESYASGQMGTNLQASRYGQQAIALDPSGCLAQLGQRRAFFKVL
jgi:hypothetical protein